MSTEKTTDLTKGRPISQIFLFAVPLVLGTLFQQLYSFADTVIVGRFLGVDALAAVGTTYSLNFLILGFVQGLTVGFGILLAQSFGAKDRNELNSYFLNGAFLSACISVLLAVVTAIAARPLLILIRTPENILSMAVEYIRVIFIGIPAAMLYNYSAGALRAVGDSRHPFYFLLFSSALNIVLDYVFIVPLGGGVAGAAWATVLSQLVSFGILLYFNLGERHGSLPLRLKNYRFRFSLYRDIVKGGLPSLWRQGLASVATICLNRSAGLYGDAAIAAMSVVTRAMQLAQSALIGFGQGFQPVCGFNYGAGLYGRVKDAFRFCVKWATVFLAAASVLGMIFAPQIVAVFSNDPEVIAFGARALRCQCAVFPLCGVIVISSMLTQTINKVWQASLLAAARQGLFFIPAVLIPPHVLGELGVQLAQSLSDVCAFALTVPLVLGVLRDMDRQERLERIS